jgi:hypothetical protein
MLRAKPLQSPTSIVREQVVDIRRLMHPVERAEANMAEADAFSRGLSGIREWHGREACEGSRFTT